MNYDHDMAARWKACDFSRKKCPHKQAFLLQKNFKGLDSVHTARSAVAPRRLSCLNICDMIVEIRVYHPHRSNDDFYYSLLI